MAWNRPSESGEANSCSLQKRSGDRFPVRGAIAGAIVVLGAAVVAWWILSDASAPVAEDGDGTKKGRIKEVTPAAAPKAEEPKTKPAVVPRWLQDDTNGMNAATLRAWKHAHRPKPSFTNDCAKSRPKPKCAIFDTYAENTLAVLMTLEPGKMLTGLPKYGESFEREFLKSCETPIIVTAEDDEYTRKLKQDMIAVKIEVRDRMANGEKFADIVNEARKEAMRLAQLKRDILGNVRATIKETGADEKDAELYYEAANKMLEKEGIAPIKPISLNKRSLLRRVQNGGKY